MNVAEACRIVHQWQELFSPSASGRSVPGNLVDAVAVIKAYLEGERADGKAIGELEIAEALLMTRQGVRWVMPFVLSAEAMETSKRRKAKGKAPTGSP